LFGLPPQFVGRALPQAAIIPQRLHGDIDADPASSLAI
jgi:hypothetical protein